MFCRVWHGWTMPENADAYESLLKNEIFSDLQDHQMNGNHGDKVEFITIMWFDSIEGIQVFAGEDYEVAVVPEKARILLSRFDKRSQHYEVKAEILLGVNNEFLTQ